MLSVPKLDDLSYDRLVELARGRIPSYAADWTDFNDHDPGITTLQAFAWLIDTLNYYIDATGEEHRLKYLNLLGLAPKRAAARSLIALSGNTEGIALAKGAKLAAGGTVFEVTESCPGVSNNMRALFLETGGAFADLTPFAGVDGQYATLFANDDNQKSALYIGFERELSGNVKFYADVQSHPDRNPFEDDFALAEFGWEYFDGARWRGSKLLEDGTCGFLKGGMISLELEGRTGSVNGHPVLPRAHYLRAVLLSGEYDAPSKIGRIYISCAQVVQTETFAQALEIEFEGNSELFIDYHIREDDLVSVAVEDGDGYSVWFEHTLDEDSLCEVVAGEYTWQRAIRFDQGRFGAAPNAGQKILVTVTNADYYDRLQLGVTTGFARERMEIDLPDLYGLRLALIGEKNGRPYMKLWDEYESLWRAAYDARVFELDRMRGEVVFGDAVSGIQPEAGLLVTAVTAKTSRLGTGNVRAGQINRVLDEGYSGLSVYNPKNAEGGSAPKSSVELEREIGDVVCQTTRAVTVRDYADIVKATPGLMIDCVNVISGGEYAKYYGGEYPAGAVLLAVKPLSERETRPVLSDIYRKRIRANVEKYRLLTTEVRVLPAKYVYIEADGRIVLNENTSLSQRRVEQRLRELIDFSHTRKFGADVVYGKVFSNLEMLDCVSKVSRLSFSCAGGAARKNEQGDIVVYPDALPWIGKINIEFVSKEGEK